MTNHQTLHLEPTKCVKYLFWPPQVSKYLSYHHDRRTEGLVFLPPNTGHLSPGTPLWGEEKITFFTALVGDNLLAHV